MRKRFLRELGELGLAKGPPSPELVTEASVAALPEPVRRYLRFMRAVGRPRDWSFRARLSGRFRMAPDRPWLDCRAWQYDTRLGISRIFQLRLRYKALLPIVARDSYRDGQGRMQAKLLDLLSVEDASGPELDTGELVTYLNDAILFAPSLLLGPETSWTASDDASFEVALTDHGTTVRALVTIDSEGRPLEFSTTDRFVRDPYLPDHPLIRSHWTTPIRGWEVVGERPVFAAGSAVWHLAQGDFAYAELDLTPGTLAFNVAPGR